MYSVMLENVLILLLLTLFNIIESFMKMRPLPTLSATTVNFLLKRKGLFRNILEKYMVNILFPTNVGHVAKKLGKFKLSETI